MAQKVTVTMTDDIDGTKADETVSFRIDGTSYEIDLSKKNAAALRRVFTPYLGPARRRHGVLALGDRLATGSAPLTFVHGRKVKGSRSVSVGASRRRLSRSMRKRTPDVALLEDGSRAPQSALGPRRPAHSEDRRPPRHAARLSTPPNLLARRRRRQMSEVAGLAPEPAARAHAKPCTYDHERDRRL